MSSTPSAPTASSSPEPAEGSTAIRRRVPPYVLVSAWAVPIMVIGQFAMLAIVPLALVVVASLRDARVRPLRWWAGLIAALYAAPLTIWLLREDGAQSLSRDMHPVFIWLIVAASAVLLLKIHARKR